MKQDVIICIKLPLTRTLTTVAHSQVESEPQKNIKPETHNTDVPKSLAFVDWNLGPSLRFFATRTGPRSRGHTIPFQISEKSRRSQNYEFRLGLAKTISSHRCRYNRRVYRISPI